MQLALAVEIELPVLLHCRRAFEQLFPLIQIAMERAAGKLTGVFHAFDESTEELQQVLEVGFLIGLGGAITYKSGRRNAVVREVPLDRILLETDAPYLTPIPFRGARNEPSHIPLIGKQVAELKQCSIDDVERSVHENMMRLFPCLMG
jgi:TatD DNase family protein